MHEVTGASLSGLTPEYSLSPCGCEGTMTQTGRSHDYYDC